MRYVAESVIELHRQRERLKGLRITYEAPVLRHFTARLEELAGAEADAGARPGSAGRASAAGAPPAGPPPRIPSGAPGA